ncbi:hypothetical protein ABZY58_26075 [Micromonospora tulbaghiae]|uniref:hypothetical protein n=1 Tax=Micromonospora tulbaghiae TaxID=479978 RepID=UPI0033A054BF
MAEIVRLEQRKETRHTSREGVSEPAAVVETTVVVRSIHGGDASVIRDFVRALDAAGAPGTARVEHQTDNGHLVRLSARWTERPDPPEPPDPPDPPV